MGVDVTLTLVTPEERPLGYFGLDAAATVEGLLRDAGIGLVSETHVRDLDHGTAVGVDGRAIVQARRAVTVSVLEGPSIPGVPTDARGFVPVDEHGAVIGLPDVWAVGDATTFPLKQGGLAARQADAAAAAIAAAAGASVAPTPRHPVMHAKLLTGRRAVHLGDVSNEDDAKVATTHLGPMLTRLDARTAA